MELPQPENRSELRLHKFITQKSVSQNFLNVAILQYQISILINTLKKNDYNGTDKALVIFILLNITLQGIIFFIITFIDYIKPNHKNAKPLNLIVTLVSGLILIINITITILTSPDISSYSS